MGERWVVYCMYFDKMEHVVRKPLLGLISTGAQSPNELQQLDLTHWGRVTHICVSKLTIIGSDNGLSPDRRQAIFWTNAGLLLIVPLGTKFNEILIEILTFSFKKMRLKVPSAKRRPFCLGVNVLKQGTWMAVQQLAPRWHSLLVLVQNHPVIRHRWISARKT